MSLIKLALSKYNYSTPYSIEYLQKNYPQLMQDPIHTWRAKHGIELIHEEPSKKEQKRIWNNWQKMQPKMKEISDKKSIELFGMNNYDHHCRIMENK